VDGGVLGVGRAAVDVDAVGDHEGAVEADAELADEVDVGLLAAVLLLAEAAEELERAGVGDRAEVAGRLLFAHADAAVLEHQDAASRVRLDPDLGGRVAAEHVVSREPLEARLVERVRGVGDQLSEEDLAVGVERVGDQLEEGADLSLELVLVGGRCRLSHRGVNLSWVTRASRGPLSRGRRLDRRWPG
jgi:hypothetical protein